MTGSEKDLTANDFPVHWPVLTRWTDNDMFGHLNNAVYYELFDTAINAWINVSLDTDPLTAPWLGVVAESGCRYFAELAFPDPLTVGLGVTRLGKAASRIESQPSNLVRPVQAYLLQQWAIGCTCTWTV